MPQAAAAVRYLYGDQPIPSHAVWNPTPNDAVAEQLIDLTWQAMRRR